jgi:CBS domain-containing protein
MKPLLRNEVAPSIVGVRGLAEIVRNACVAAALDGHESAALSGLCNEGAWEAALSAIRRLDLAVLMERSDAEPKALLVRNVMARDVATLRPGDPLVVADDVLRLGRIRHLPVVDEAGGLLGLLTQRDLLRAALSPSEEPAVQARRGHLNTLLVSAVMTRNVVVTSPDTPLRDAATEMLRRKFGCLPVLQDGLVVGIVTEADFVRLAL